MSARSWVDVGVHTVLALIGIVGLATSFDDAGWLLAGAGGLLVGTGVALLARRLRLGALLTVALALVGYVLFGSALAVPEQAVAGVVPTTTSLASLAIGAVNGWADLLTLRAPVRLPDYVTVVPYVSAWLVGLVGITLATRWLPRHRRTPGRVALLVIGPLVLYLASILLGTAQPFYPGLRGVAFAAIALIWLGWRHSVHEKVQVERSAGLRRRKLAGTAIVVGAAVALGALSGAALAPPASDRFVLRDQIQPPFQPLEFASPLSGFRQYSKLHVDDPLFTVTGLQPGERLRLSTMDSYDGVVWSVAGAQIDTDGSGSFALVGRELPAPPLVTSAGNQTVDLTVEGYRDVWIPSTGYPTTITLPDTSRSDLEGMRYNAATGSAVLSSGLHRGDHVTVTSELQKGVDDAGLEDVPIAAVQLAPVSVIPDIVAAKATEFAGAAKTPIDQLRNIELTLHSTGFLSHGTASDSVPSLAGHGADRMEQLFTRSSMVGDEEQYASAFALMARSLGYPARVVMGFAPSVPSGGGAVTITGHDVTAWVEVPFAGVGWVPFYPTPKQTDVPQDQNPKPQTQPQPQVRQPPRTQNNPDDLISAVAIDDSKKKDDALFGIPGWAVAIGLSLLIPALVIFVPLLVLGALRRRRVRRRRGAARAADAVAGAWDELVDRYAELGYAAPEHATRPVVARALESQSALPLEKLAGRTELAEPARRTELAELAGRIDEAVFRGRELTGAEVDTAWSDALGAAESARGALPRGRRLLARYRLSAVRSWAHRLVVSTAAATAAAAGAARRVAPGRPGVGPSPEGSAS